VRLIDVTYSNTDSPSGAAWIGNDDKRAGRESEVRGFAVRTRRIATTAGWQPSCACEAATIPCTVLDPFGGSGTVGAVAEQLGRHSVLIELSPAYVRLADRRTAQLGLFTQGASERMARGHGEGALDLADDCH
jgi:hypothetical protein